MKSMMIDSTADMNNTSRFSLTLLFLIMTFDSLKSFFALQLIHPKTFITKKKKLITDWPNNFPTQQRYIHNKTLIILPLPLIEQWIDAIKKITNTNPYIYHPLYKNEVYEDNPITITSYGLLGKQKSLIIEKKWKRVIFDESHHIKNRKTSCFKGCKELISDIFWFISGTPIQNTIKDFGT